MTIDERQRYQLHQSLETHLGPESAATLMAYLPPVGWADVATKRDLDHLGHQLRAEFAELRTELRTEIAELRTELRTEIADVRTEIAELRTELRTEIADVRTEIAGVRSELQTEIAGVRTEIHKAVRTMTLTMVTANVAIVTVAATLTNLFG